MYGKIAVLLLAVFMLTPSFIVQGAEQGETRGDEELILRVAIQDDIKTLNFLSAGDVWTWDVIGWMFEGLTWKNYSNNDHIEPWAAEWFHHGPEDTWSDEPYSDDDNNSDYLNWTVKLREGIKWHDWESQTPENRTVKPGDVIFSMRLEADVPKYMGALRCIVARNPDGSMMYGRDIDANTSSGTILGIDVSSQRRYPDLPVVLAEDTGDNIIRFRLNEVYSDFTSSTLQLPIVPERIWKEHISDKLTWSDPKATVSFGVFSFGYWNTTDHTSKINTFRDYFRPEYDTLGRMKPYIDGIFFKRYGTTDGAVMALTSGEIDYIAWAIDPAFIDTIYADPDLTLVRNSDLGFFYLAFNMRKPEFGYAGYDPNDARYVPAYNGNYTDVGRPFRVAFSHIINKEYIVSKYLMGFGSRGTSVVSPVNSYWYNPDIKTYDYDPRKAAEILDEQGWTDTDGDGWRELPYRGDDRIEMIVPPADYDPVCWSPYLIIQQDALAVGLNVRAIPTNFGTMVNQIESHDFDIYALGWSIQDPTASARVPCNFFSSYADGGGHNYVGYHNQSFDRLCDEFNSEMDLERKREIGFELQETIAEDAPHSVLYYRDVLEAYNNRLNGWVPLHGSIFNRASAINLMYRPCGLPMDISISAPASMNGGGQAEISVYVTDRWTGDPIGNREVRFSADAGEFSQISAVTDENGKAVATYTAPVSYTMVYAHITASATDIYNDVEYSGQATIMVYPPSEVKMSIESTPKDIISVMNGSIATLDISLYFGNGSMPDENAVEVEYTIVPEGASVTFTGYENGTWHYGISATAPPNRTMQYTITITARFAAPTGTATSSRSITIVAVGESVNPPPPPPTPPDDGGGDIPILGLTFILSAVAVASVILIARRR